MVSSVNPLRLKFIRRSGKVLSGRMVDREVFLKPTTDLTRDFKQAMLDYIGEPEENENKVLEMQHNNSVYRIQITCIRKGFDNES